MKLVSKRYQTVSKFFKVSPTTFLTRILNQKGQAAIFVALIFNVLFVFFAMAINVALVVGDKINLQNSADLASYYAAAKQAELLNVIAHENYQIRQSYKLMSWRYRVLGSMGFYQGAARNPVWSGEVSDTDYAESEAPSVCVTYKPTWEEVPQAENLCNRPGLKIPPLPEVKVIAGFLGINHGIAALSRQLRLQFDKQCQKLGAYNWWFAMSTLHAFRLDQRNRKQVIVGIAKTISGGNQGDFTDLDGNSVLEGAKQTFLKNLSYANRQSFDSGGEFVMMNSLEGLDTKLWLPEIQIAPTLIYTDVDNEAGCNASPQPISKLPQRTGAMDLLKTPVSAGGLGASDLFEWTDKSVLQDSDFQFSIGYEKNPWYMPYVGVRVKTSPRQIFFPFGSGLEMSARSFAKPFGGRIGPWFQANWDRGAPTSSGDRVDPFVAPRTNNISSPDDRTRLPNYSRYPGDKLGLKSKLAINSLTGLKDLGITFDSYKNIKSDIVNGADNDILAWKFDSDTAPEVRNFELAALAPDLFDITYYSIEPNFTKNYLGRLQANKSKLNIGSNVVIRGDLGHHGTVMPAFSVQEQMAVAQSKSLQRSEAFYFVRQKSHLLTSWLPAEGPFNYGVEESLKNFGKCALPDDRLKFPNPGSCVAGGGRTGYSVKLVNRDALFSNQHKIGGGAAPNSILNPPNASEGW